MEWVPFHIPQNCFLNISPVFHATKRTQWNSKLKTLSCRVTKFYSREKKRGRDSLKKKRKEKQTKEKKRGGGAWSSKF